MAFIYIKYGSHFTELGTVKMARYLRALNNSFWTCAAKWSNCFHGQGINFWDRISIRAKKFCFQDKSGQGWRNFVNKSCPDSWMEEISYFKTTEAVFLQQSLSCNGPLFISASMRIYALGLGRIACYSCFIRAVAYLSTRTCVLHRIPMCVTWNTHATSFTFYICYIHASFSYISAHK